MYSTKNVCTKDAIGTGIYEATATITSGGYELEYTEGCAASARGMIEETKKHKLHTTQLVLVTRPALTQNKTEKQKHFNKKNKSDSRMAYGHLIQSRYAIDDRNPLSTTRKSSHANGSSWSKQRRRRWRLLR